MPDAKPSLFTPRTLLPIAVLLLALLLWLAHSHTTFNVHSLLHQLRSVSPLYILLALGCSYFGYWLRAWRWAILLSPIHKTTARQMFPSQLIGFTIVGLFGRLSDLGRPYLIARRTHTSIATQLAVYSIERAFDLAAAAILFSVTLAFAPRNMPHHEAFARAGLLSLAATLFLAAFALALRFQGDRVAALATRLLRPLSPPFAESSGVRIREFSHGLHIVSTLHEFLAALALSIATLSFAATMLLLATSLGGSLLQLPILGWFTQIAILAATLHGFFAVPLEIASACGAVILCVSNLAVIPAGLLAARSEGISLRDAANGQGSEDKG
jgi:uncharacterized membrane protein YbhN (UPF0104 family)